MKKKIYNLLDISGTFTRHADESQHLSILIDSKCETTENNKAGGIGEGINCTQSLKIDPDLHQDDVEAVCSTQKPIIKELIHFNKPKTAFTLAEVLITLAIIGIVAALTIPALTSKYNRYIVETRLKHFYSLINQAIRMSELENGEVKDWDVVVRDDASSALEWADKYLAKYIKTVNTAECKSGSTAIYKCGCLYFKNGSGVAIHNHVWYFYPEAKKIGKTGTCGKDFFAFALYIDTPGRVEPFNNTSSQNYVEHNYTDSDLRKNSSYGCNASNTHWCSGWFCTKIIAKNGWKIPDDYPYKF